MGRMVAADNTGGAKDTKDIRTKIEFFRLFRFSTSHRLSLSYVTD